MLSIRIDHNLGEIKAKLDAIGKGMPGVAREAINRTADWAHTYANQQVRKVFDRPTPYTLRSLRVRYANTQNLTASLWFRRRSSEDDVSWGAPQIKGGQRELKPMELRMQRINLLPRGWMIVPGGAAPLDAYGNMSRGEISRILNVLGTYTESGYNKADFRTRQRLKAGNVKRNEYGFEYWVNPVGAGRQQHLLPGVYRRVRTGFGSSLKPMMIFIPRAQYKMRLDLHGAILRATSNRMEIEVDKALKSYLVSGSASAFRREARYQ